MRSTVASGRSEPCGNSASYASSPRAASLAEPAPSFAFTASSSSTSRAMDALAAGGATGGATRAVLTVARGAAFGNASGVTTGPSGFATGAAVSIGAAAVGAVRGREGAGAEAGLRGRGAVELLSGPVRLARGEVGRRRFQRNAVGNARRAFGVDQRL